ATIRRGAAAAAEGELAIQKAAGALAGDDLQQLVDAYLAGRGSRREIRAATNAARNAEIVEQAIARLVDSLREMQQVATKLGGEKSELDKLMKQLKGK